MARKLLKTIIILALVALPVLFYLFFEKTSGQLLVPALKDSNEVVDNGQNNDPYWGKEQDFLEIIKLASSTFKAQVEFDKNPKLVSQWVQGGEEIIINGAFFNEDYRPTGFLVVNHEVINKRMFDQDKSGLIITSSSTFSIRDLGLEPIEADDNFEYALQSYPFLIKDGKPALKTDSGKIARRTALGVDEEGNAYIIVLANRSLSLYEFMNEILKTGIKFTNVLNLDGGPSTGIYANWEGKERVLNSYTAVSSIIRFEKKIDN